MRRSERGDMCASVLIPRICHFQVLRPPHRGSRSSWRGSSRVSWASKRAGVAFNLRARPAAPPYGERGLFMGLPADERFTAGNPWISVSRPYYVMGHAIVAKAAAGIATPDDLRGKRVAIDAASVADFYLFDKGIERGIYKGQEAAFRAVVTGEAAAALLWLPVASWLARVTPRCAWCRSPKRVSSFDRRGVRRRDRDLAEAVDRALERLQSSGEAQAVLARYGAVAASPALPESKAAVPVSAPASSEAGRSLFSTACSHCHRAEGIGGGIGGAVPTIRNYEGGQENSCGSSRTARRGHPWEHSKAF